MPATSKSQQRLFGMANAYKKHKFHPHNHALEHKVKEVARDMSVETISHYAKTKHKGLPEKKAFVHGFLKRAHEANLPFSELPEYIKEAGLDKEAFLPLILDALGTVAGGALGESMASGLVGRAAAGVAGSTGVKMLPSFLRGGKIEKGLASFAQTAEHPIPKGGLIGQPKSFRQQLPGQVGMTVGMGAAAPITGAINNKVFPEPNLNLPTEQYPQYNGQ